MIQDPVTLKGGVTVGDALDIMKEHKIGGIPVVDDENTYNVTNRDLRFEKKRSRKVDEVMTSENLIVTKDGSDFTKVEQMLREHRMKAS